MVRAASASPVLFVTVIEWWLGKKTHMVCLRPSSPLRHMPAVAEWRSEMPPEFAECAQGCWEVGAVLLLAGPVLEGLGNRTSMGGEG